MNNTIIEENGARLYRVTGTDGRTTYRVEVPSGVGGEYDTLKAALIELLALADSPKAMEMLLSILKNRIVDISSEIHWRLEMEAGRLYKNQHYGSLLILEDKAIRFLKDELSS